MSTYTHTDTEETQRRVIDWRSQSDEGLRLRCGELTAQEIRTIRAVLNAILPPNAVVTDGRTTDSPKQTDDR